MYWSFLILHILSAFLGALGMSVLSVLFLKFTKDFRISNHELRRLDKVNKFIWTGIVLFFISGLILYFLVDQAELASAFYAKLAVSVVILISSIVSTFVIRKKLTRMAFNYSVLSSENSMSFWRKLTFVNGSLCLCSWYTAFVYGALSVVASFQAYMIAYALICFFFMMVGLVVERMIFTRMQ